MSRNSPGCEAPVLSAGEHQGKAGLAEHLHTLAGLFPLAQALDRRAEQEIYGVGAVHHELTV